ncbi:uncharacterized protein LOC109543313 [Dendroctonus ponderosae]|uniref:uncharacterized protein LOC109543313 n=1 Tax=Dendroctonus ponderosae TaxID=77166 RepID=UPI0020364727|nr:uncharacterized protein LOC109543313 [Dendroctonus ponderosae]
MKSAERLLLVLIPGVLVIAGVFLGMAMAQKGYTICDVQGCNCTVPAGGWKNVNCYLLDDQDLVLQQGNIPKETTEIFLSGGHSIVFNSKTFNSLKALALLRIEKVRSVTIEPKAFFNIQSSSLLVQILSCDALLLRTQAFEDMQGSLSTEIMKTKYVKLEESPFSKLSNCTFEDIDEVALEKGAFEIKNLGSIGRHGPVSVVLFENVFILDIQKEVFRTSLAQISFKDCRIGNINFEAFTSAQISTVLLVNTSIERMETGAFSERILIVDFQISKCTIQTLQTKAITAGMAKLTVNHSTLTDIEPNAIASTVAKVEVIGNQIINFFSTAITIHNWNSIIMDQNIIKNLYSDFIVISKSSEIEGFSFKGNEIYNAMEGSLDFIQTIDEGKMLFDDNFFNQGCGCDLPDWIKLLTNSTAHTALIMDSSFCRVDEALSKCFSLPEGIINMQNFSEKTCSNNTICEPYKGETRTINTTGKIFVDSDQSHKQSWLIFIIVLIGFFIMALVGTFVALLVRGSRWLKRKGYFRNHYYNNQQSNEEEEEENTIVTIDTENEKLEIPQELTIEFLQELSKRLDDPATHQEASDMIERLYEMFIVDESYENNNREEEAHLYEELGNLSLQIPPPPYQEQAPATAQVSQAPPENGPRGILKLMEEKFSTNEPNASNTDLSNTSTSSTKPILTSDYSEPLDKDVHLYSELKAREEAKKDSIKSNGSMVLRPLPDRPGYLFQAGPSTKL